MFQGCCFEGFCRFGSSVIETYALSGFGCCTGLPPLVLSWNMDHGSLSTLCLPWWDRMLCKGNTQWQVLHTEIHMDKWLSKKNELLLLWSLGVNLALCQTGTSVSAVSICKGSFHGICKISLFLSFPLKKVSVTQTSQSSQLDACVGCPVASPLS